MMLTCTLLVRRPMTWEGERGGFFSPQFTAGAFEIDFFLIDPVLVGPQRHSAGSPAHRGGGSN